MIDHVVLFKMKPEASSSSIEAMCRALEALKSKIPELADIRAGINFSDRSQGHGVMLVSRFKTRGDLEVYTNHPEHRKVVSENINPIRESVLVGDLEY